MPRSKTATDCDVFAVISLAIKRPVQPPPMMATSTGLRLVMKPRFRSPLALSGAVQPYCHVQLALSRAWDYSKPGLKQPVLRFRNGQRTSPLLGLQCVDRLRIWREHDG